MHQSERDLGKTSRSRTAGTYFFPRQLLFHCRNMVDQCGGFEEKSRKWLKELAAAQDLKVGRKHLINWAHDQANEFREPEDI